MTLRINPPSRRSSQGGFTMVELLVVAAILAFGLLGLTALQTLTMRVGAGSRQRVAAAYVGHSVLDRIYMEGAQSYFYESSGQPVPAGFTRVFTGAGTSGNIGSFDANGTLLSTSMSYPGAVITATWDRLDPKTAAPVAGAPQINEYVVNVSYIEGDATRWITVSRLVRY